MKEEKRFSQYLVEYDMYCDEEEAKGNQPLPFAQWLPEQIEKNLSD